VTSTQPHQPSRPSYVEYAKHVAGGLARHPQAVVTIGTVFRPDPALGVNAPWWNRRAVAYLDSQLRPGQWVLEWGSGGSTAWLTARGARVTSVEHDPGWAAQVMARCPDADVRAILPAAAGTIAEPFHVNDLRNPKERFFDDYIAVIGEFPSQSLDVVIVDGMCRAECFRRAVPKVRPGGLLIIDDSDMPPYRRLSDVVPGWQKTSFAGFKASKDLRQTSFFRCPR
jgi:hypothetical protein